MALLNTADALFLNSHAVDRVYLAATIVWPPDYVQWDSGNKNASVTLSNSDRTATITAGAGNRGVHSLGPLTRKSYWEIEIVSLTNNAILGVSSPGARTNTLTVGAGSGFGYVSNGSSASPLNVTYTVTDRIGFAYDPFFGFLWVSKNGTWLGNDTTGSPAVIVANGAGGQIFVPFMFSTGNLSVELVSNPVNFDNAAPSGFLPVVNAGFPGGGWSMTSKGVTMVLSSTRSVMTKLSTGHANVRMGTDMAKNKQVYAVKVTADGAGSTAKNVGFMAQTDSNAGLIGTGNFGVGYRSGGTVVRNGTTLQTYTSWGAVNDVVMAAIDVPNALIWYGLNGTWNGSPSAGTGSVGSFVSDGSLNYCWLAAGSTDAGDAFQLVTFPYSVPSGFVAVDPLATEFGTYYTNLDGTLTNSTLSNRNLTVTHSNTTGNSGAISTTYKESGKWYFEITITTSTGANDGCGLVTSTGTLTNAAAATPTNSVVCVRSTGNIFSNGANSTKTLGALANGDVVCWAIDLDNNLVWARKGAGNWNGDASANPATGAVGVSCSSFSAVTLAPHVGFSGTGTAASDAYTGNFGASAFTQSVPSGFTSGWTRNA